MWISSGRIPAGRVLYQVGGVPSMAVAAHVLAYVVQQGPSSRKLPVLRVETM